MKETNALPLRTFSKRHAVFAYVDSLKVSTLWIIFLDIDNVVLIKNINISP